MYHIRIERFLMALSCTLLLSACGAQITGEATDPTLVALTERKLKIEDLQDKGVAPELENDVWLNVEAPLRLSDLTGKVVLLDFWTFG